MADKIKLVNNQKFDVGIILPDNPRGINIKAGSFYYVTQDDIDYIASISTIFQSGILTVEDKDAEVLEQIGIDIKNDENFITNEEIHKKLGMSAKKIGEWLATVTEDHILDRIYEEAMKMDLPLNKVKVLQEKMPNREFLD